MRRFSSSGTWENCSRKYAVVVAIFLLALSVSLGGEPYGEAALPPRFSLLCWNIHKEPAAVEAISSLGTIPDVLCLQEWESELSSTSFPTHSGNFSRAWRKPSGGFSGVATFSTARSTKEPETLITRWREALFFTRKSSLVTEFRLVGSSETLLVVNTHAIQFHPGPIMLRSQMKVIARRIRQHPGPLIACGDYNTWRGDRLRIVRKALTESGGREVGFPHGRTTALPVVLVALGNTRTPLDRVFVRGLKVVSQPEVLALEGSDHRALRVIFESLPRSSHEVSIPIGTKK